jgi:multimeric flavodoxin WrbA
MDKVIKVLGISCSPRKGNSMYMLDKAMEAETTFPVSIEKYSFKGKKFSPCLSCHKCVKNGGKCIVIDDYEELRQKWISSDVVLYSFPVYHMGIPGQLKCFIDRLGNSFYGYYSVSSMRHLKVIGALTSGCHFFGGQELAINQIIQHAVLLNSLPVSGDGWHSYIGAAAWTNNELEHDSLKKLHEMGDFDASISITAAQSVFKRCVDIAAIVKTGVVALASDLGKDIRFKPLLERLNALQEE